VSRCDAHLGHVFETVRRHGFALLHQFGALKLSPKELDDWGNIAKSYC